jgi:hypothetical protein
VDFVATRSPEGWDVYAIEINLRKGGTTHPFLTMQFLTNGSYDAEAAAFSCRTGKKFYIASDHLDSPGYCVLTPDDLLDLLPGRGLGWDNERERGGVFHMISALPVAGRVGLTAVGNSAEDADDLYTRAGELLATAARS